uniref:Repressor of RNA polymerase III transcription n=1 Tax=Salix viminalis TaxID=40686 RepID=A0A6N2MZT5_SALVM
MIKTISSKKPKAIANRLDSHSSAAGSESNPAQQYRVNARNLSKNKDHTNNHLQSNIRNNPGLERLRFSDNKPLKFKQITTVNCFRSRRQIVFKKQSAISMKFLEYTPLERMNEFLSHLNLGERTIKGYLEPYSCKHTGTDKKLSLSLENEMLDYLGKSSDTDSSSPAEFLLSRSSRKTLIYLVLTLYRLYPDYDFSAVNAHQFFTEESWDSCKQIFDSYMFEASKAWIEENEGISLVETLYKALDEVVKLSDWSFNFFFYNRKLKRVVSFRFCCFSNLVAEGFLLDDSSYEEDGEIFDDMDMHNELITFKHPQVRCQGGSPEDGTSANIVDANLGILRGRVSEVKMKERLERWRRLKNGWNYETGYDRKYRRDGVLSKSLELMGFASGALGFVFLSGSLCIWLVSLLVHLSR